MSLDSQKHCPACRGGVLFAAPDRAGVLGCSGCGGIWADNATSQLVAAVLDPELVSLADLAATAVIRRAKDALPLPPEGPRACPECRGALVRINTASTNLDVCGLHGTWFDRGELQRVSRILDGDRDRKIPHAPGEGKWVVGNTALSSARSPSSGVDATAVATGLAADLAVEAGFMVIRAVFASANSRADD